MDDVSNNITNTPNSNYNTRSKVNKYGKPKFIVNINSTTDKGGPTQEFSLVISNLVDMSNKLMSKNRLKQLKLTNINKLDTYSSDDDSDYIEEDKQNSSKYVKYNNIEKQYFETLGTKEKKYILRSEKLIKKFQSTKIPLRFKILELKRLSVESKYNILHKLEQLNKLDPTDNEYFKLSSWTNWLDRIPFNKFSKIPIDDIEDSTKVSNFLVKSKKILDDAVYGHAQAKDQIIITLAKMITNKLSTGTCIAIQGPMGNGKTTLVKQGICKALSRPFGFIALGGAQDSNFMLGHDYTYEGSKPGRIVEILAESQSMNPVIYFDELDKISETKHGDEIANLLCHLTDTSQNMEFQDKYLSGIKIDLSKIIFIFSYNDASKINPILLDRMYKISTKGFNTKDKLKIAKNYLIPDILKEFKLADIDFTDECLREIIAGYTENEEGVRNLKRQIETIISKINLIRLINKETNVIDCSIKTIEFPITITKEIMNKLILKTDDTLDVSIMGLYS